MGRVGLWVSRGMMAASLLAWAALSWGHLAYDAVSVSARYGLLAALVVAGVVWAVPPLGGWVSRALSAGPRWLSPVVASVVSAGLTVWLYLGPMHGQPMARDACVYIFQGRALSHFSWGAPVLGPVLSQSVHFLFEGADGRLHGVFAAGYPLFLAPFVRLGLPWLAGAVTAVGLAWATSFYARVVSPDPKVERVSLVVALGSFAWAIELGDLLSHAFVAALATVAMALVLGMVRGARDRLRDGVALGVCLGWLFAARMLDGILLGLTLAPLVLAALWRRRVGWKVVGVAALVALPFVGFVALHQKAATGSWSVPTSVAYARRADWPATCLRLGFGVDVGCSVEHRDERRRFGDDGYTPDDAVRVVSDRTGRLGLDLFGASFFALLALVGVLVRPTLSTVVGVSWAVILTVGYGLFYYGNSVVYGARHLFPAGPALVVLLVDAALALGTRYGRARGAGAVALGLLVWLGAVERERWKEGLFLTREIMSRRTDVRAIVAAQHLGSAVVIVKDISSFAAALDPWTDARARRLIVLDDRTGNLDARRYRPSVPIWYLDGSGQASRARAADPPPGFDVEIERAWPSVLTVDRVGAAMLHTRTCCGFASSGEHMLFAFEAEPGGRLELPFELRRGGVFEVRLKAFRAPDYGTWVWSIDDRTMGTVDGYAPQIAPVDWAIPGVALTAGRHQLRFRCVGKDARSRGYRLGLDRLSGAVVPSAP